MSAPRHSQLELQLLASLRLYSLPEPVAEYRFEPGRRYRFDFAYPEQKIALEAEGGIWGGGRHTRGKGFENDCRKYNLATLRGWAVYRFTAAMVNDFEAAETVKQALEATC